MKLESKFLLKKYTNTDLIWKKKIKNVEGGGFELDILLFTLSRNANTNLSQVPHICKQKEERKKHRPEVVYEYCGYT